MHVSHPDEPVTFDPVPEIVLTAQMHRAERRVPDTVETLVGTLEKTLFLHRAHQLDSPDEMKADRSRRHKIYPDEPESAVADFNRPKRRCPYNVVTHRMIVCGALLTDIAHCLGNGFAEPDAQPHPKGIPSRTDLNAAMEFTAEIKKNARNLPLVLKVARRGTRPYAVFGHLSIMLFQKPLRPRHLHPSSIPLGGLGKPNDPYRIDVCAHARINLVRKSH